MSNDQRYDAVIGDRIPQVAGDAPRMDPQIDVSGGGDSSMPGMYVRPWRLFLPGVDNGKTAVGTLPISGATVSFSMPSDTQYVSLP